jgi:hypothetical protein
VPGQQFVLEATKTGCWMIDRLGIMMGRLGHFHYGIGTENGGAGRTQRPQVSLLSHSSSMST